MPAHLSVGPAQGDEHREREQLAHLQVDAAAPDGVAEAVGGQVALRKCTSSAGVSVRRAATASSPIMRPCTALPCSRRVCGVDADCPGSGSSTPASVRTSIDRAQVVERAGHADVGDGRIDVAGTSCSRPVPAVARCCAHRHGVHTLLGRSRATRAGSCRSRVLDQPDAVGAAPAVDRWRASASWCARRA